jgi:hypothetical protein
MQRQHISHPLDNLIHGSHLFLLEALIPFVSRPVKAPLATYIKITELGMILQGLKDEQELEESGLNMDIHNEADIISALSGCGFGDMAQQLENIKQMSAMMEMMNMFKDDEPPQCDSFNPNPPPHDNSSGLYESIIDILNESEPN